MTIEDTREPRPSREMIHPVRFAVLDEYKKVLGETVIDDPTWKLLGNDFHLDEEIWIDMTREGTPHYCKVQYARGGNPIVFALRRHDVKLQPGDGLRFPRQKLSIDFEIVSASPKE